jgi:diguanylate cyclase (GGDEF)-like protein
VRGSIDRLRDLFRKTPLPSDELVSIMVDSTLYMAGPSVTRDFSAKMTSFLEKVYATYQLHLEHPSEEVLLFSSQDLSALFEQDYREHLSLEGFHTMAITMLEALMEESSDEDVNWVIEQIAHLHLRIARLLNNAAHTTAIDRSRSEWLTFHMVDDALREDGDPATAYRLMLSELGELGVREASLYLLSEPVEFVGVGGFGLSDLVRPVGRLSHGSVSVDVEAPFVALQSVLDHALGGFETVGAVCSVGGVVAGNEMVGLLVIDPSGLDESRQLMVFLNLGLAIKHLQMIADEREMNELLNRNNLLLEQQSQHDELTGLLNRRGYLNRIGHLLRERQGDDGAILFLDLDGLKTINDTYGHDMGDEAIRSTARLLADRMPKDGLLARLGGDEFVAFVPGCSPEEVAQLCEGVQEDMGAFNARGDAPFILGISCGVACFSVDEKTHARLSQLMGQADAQLYQMKRAHKLSRRYVQES